LESVRDLIQEAYLVTNRDAQFRILDLMRREVRQHE